MNETHLALMIRNRIEKYGERTALRYKEKGQWKDISWNVMGEQIRAVAKGLLEMDVKAGDMVAIFSQNSPAWTIADYGILKVRGVSVPIYATSSAKQAGYIINEAEIKIIFVGSQDQYDKTKALQDASSCLKKIIVFDDNVTLGGRDTAMYFKDFLDLGRRSSRDPEVEDRLNSASIDDLATVIYTSGTTGEPKGVMLHHSIFYHSFPAHVKRLVVSDQDVSVCFLPLTHVFERTWCYFASYMGMVICYCDETPRIIEYLQEAKPTVMCAVPRFYEKIYSAVFEKLENASPTKKKLFTWAIGVGEQVYVREKEKMAIPALLTLKHTIAGKLVLDKIRNIVGGRIRFSPAPALLFQKKSKNSFIQRGYLSPIGTASPTPPRL
jgi:long-chain acyl-CoA synthetase